MLDIAPSELLLVAFVALIVIGPKDLPKALRVVGYWVGKARGVARQFRQGFDSMVREAELEEMEKRWAAENERIMREHPSADDAAADSGTTEPVAGEPVPVEGGTQPAGADDDGTPPPVMVERPQVVEAEVHPAPADEPHPAAPKPDVAPS